MVELIIFGIVNTFIMTLSGVAGGGAGLFTAPFLIALGINPLTAITTSKITGLGAAMGAGAKYHREKILDLKTQATFMAIGGIGAIIGSSALVKFSAHEEVIQNLLGYVILLVGLPLLFSKNLGLESKIRSRRSKSAGFVAIAVVSVVASALSGIATAYLLIMMFFFGMTAINASVAKRSTQFVAAIVSLIVFTSAGFLDYKLGLVALVTSVLGSYLGAHIAIKKGNKFVIYVFGALSTILALNLIFN